MNYTKTESGSGSTTLRTIDSEQSRQIISSSQYTQSAYHRTELDINLVRSHHQASEGNSIISLSDLGIDTRISGKNLLSDIFIQLEKIGYIADSQISCITDRERGSRRKPQAGAIKSQEFSFNILLPTPADRELFQRAQNQTGLENPIEGAMNALSEELARANTYRLELKMDYENGYAEVSFHPNTFSISSLTRQAGSNDRATIDGALAVAIALKNRITDPENTANITNIQSLYAECGISDDNQEKFGNDYITATSLALYAASPESKYLISESLTKLGYDELSKQIGSLREKGRYDGGFNLLK